jgi:hypothetical protein
MHKLLLLFCFISVTVFAQTNWPLTKASTSVQVAIPSEFGIAAQQPLANTGWEDGVFISRDGLNLYSLYLPADALKWSIDGAPCHFTAYQRGPTFGMDLITSPVPTCTVWLHADILISSRTSTSVPFPAWSMSNLQGPIYSEGAPQMSLTSPTLADIVVFTSNKLPPYNTDVYMIRNSSINPSASSATILPAPVTQTTTEDNPHLERLNANDLVLFFDSPDRPSAVGGLDLWYATSNDNGGTWSNPQQVSSLNTTGNEHQPHLYKDAMNQWWLYYTTPDISGKYAIYRSQQTVPGNWDSWGPKQLVVGPGNSAGIGEPTLTQNGDLSFVVVMEDPNFTSTDRFDADPWFLPKLNSTSIGENSKAKILLFPNPTQSTLKILLPDTEEYYISLSNILGEELMFVKAEKSLDLDKNIYGEGIFFVKIYRNATLITTQKIIFTK